MTSPFSWPHGKRAAISLTFDDARLSQADVGLSVLENCGVKATFYVSFEQLEKRLAVWEKVPSQGHEIGNHTLTHPCTGNFNFSRHKALEEYSLDRMEDELLRANETCHELLGVTPKTFAYPCGQTFVGRGEDFRSYVPLVARHFRAGRGFNAECANIPDFCDPCHLFGIDADGKTVDQLIELARQAATAGTWLVLAGHNVGTLSRQTVDTQALVALCHYAHENDIWMGTVAEIVEFVRAARPQ